MNEEENSPPRGLPRSLLERVLEAAYLPEAARTASLAELASAWPEHAAELGQWLGSASASLSQSSAAGGGDTKAWAGEPEDVGVHEQIGPYRILEELGSGGMGTVYLAEQREPIRRRVALKVVKLGMDSKAILRRFELERQALAVMNDDTIAKVFDAGTTERGQPYFVMEHVPGLPITSYCDRHKLSLAERIELFQKVCAGVQHAHQKGIIHRDLKPGNVLVSEQRGKAQPKIIDFGLARATDHMMLQATLFTEQHQVIGTPEYMSPEQADPTAADIDTRSDIYSLGVMLYELLTGELPFVGKDLRRAGLAEMQRVIREVEPPRPSAKLSSLGEAASSTSAARRTTSSALLRALRSDLDWVVLKAMEKDRSRRYESAAGLAMDLGRYLAHEPLIAGPPSSGYRLRKLARRYRAQVVAGALVFVTLLGGAIGTTLFAVESSANAKRYRQRTEEFDLLALVERLQLVRLEEKELYPAWPDRVVRMREWLRNDGEAVGRLRAGLPRVRTTLAALRARSPTTEEEREASRRGHERYAELEKLRGKLVSRRRAQAVREGGAPPEFGLDPALEAKTAMELNQMAWPLVSPTREEYGREPEGLALERLGHAKATGRELAWLSDALAWALLANGMDEEALAASRAAVDAAADGSERAMFGDNLRRLTRAVDAARGDSGRLALARLERDVEDLEAELAEWRLPAEADRFLHGRLTAFVRELEVFLEQGVTDMERRLFWAERVEQLTIHRFASRWAEARESVLAADGVVASELYGAIRTDLLPQMGLVPIGMNPKTKLWEFYHLRSAWDAASGTNPEDLEIPSHDPGTGHVRIGDDTGIVFVLIPGGTFIMGAQKDDPDAPNYDRWADDDETPHQETVEPYFLARHELTQGQWKRLSGGQRPSGYKVGMEDYRGGVVTMSHPVEQTSWNDCTQLLAEHGLGLPTEAGWEYSCRAGTTTPWYSGGTPASLEDSANILDEFAKQVSSWQGETYFDDGYLIHAPVGSFQANAFGLFDMHGNVREWCLDRYRETVSRIYRGGSCGNPARLARSAIRYAGTPDSSSYVLGVRAARTLH